MSNKQIHDIYSVMLFNPTFKKFVDENKSKTIEEIAMDYDINILKEKNVQEYQCESNT